jgi:hypothetical protein
MEALFSLITMNVNLPSFHDAMRGSERDQWLKAIFVEIAELIKRGTFEFVNSSDMTMGHLIDGKWVLKRKYLSSGEIQKYKARMVARGFIQREGIDYNETIASTARAASWRIIMIIAGVRGWIVWQIDFVAAYLNGSLREKMLMKQFPLLKEFFESYPAMAKELEYDVNKVIRLLKPFYDLKQAAAAWQTRAKELMKARGFKLLITDDAVFFSPKKSIIVSIYVDDFLVVGFFRKEINAFVSSLRLNVTIENFGEIDWYLGVKMVKFSPKGNIRLNLE